jgi:hypothetical protein
MRAPFMGRRLGPTLDLDFSKGAAPTGIPTTRGTPATLIGADGRIQWAPMNLVTNSEMVGVVAGTPGSTPGLAISATVNGLTRTIISADGGKLVVRFAGTANATGQIGLDPSTAVANAATVGQVFTAGALVNVVAGSTNGKPIMLRLVERNSGGSVLVSTDVVMTPGVFATVTRVANNATIAFMQFAIRIDYALNDVIDVTFELSAPQFNYGTTLQPYQPTTTAAFYGHRIQYDPLTLAPIGLLVEESRTNLCPDHLLGGASSFITYGALDTSIEGMREILGDGSSNSHYSGVGGQVTPAASTVYTASCMVEFSSGLRRVQVITSTSHSSGGAYAIFNAQTGLFTFAAAGITTTHVRRLSATRWLLGLTYTSVAAPAAASPILIGAAYTDADGRLAVGTETGLLWKVGGAQLEAGPHMSSLIPTYGAPVTRGNETPTRSTAGWLKPGQGTLVVEADFQSPAYSTWVHTAAILDDGSATNRIFIRKGTAGNIDPGSYTAGAFQALPFGGLSMAYGALNTMLKLGMSYGAGIYRLARDGAAATNETTGQAVPTVSALGIGCQSFGGGQINGHVRRIRYWPALFPASVLALLTR